MKPRLIVLTDISSLTKGFREPDDTQSLVRLLLYSNELNIEGIIATYTEHGHNIRPEYIYHIIQQYGKVYPRLLEHDRHYPSSDELSRVVKEGNSNDGLAAIGEECDTEGSDWIITCADKEDERPLWISVWGGTTDLAQALWKVRETRSEEQVDKFLAKLRIFSIGDQYGIGSWIREEFLTLFYITSYASFRGMYRGGDSSLCTSEWVRACVSRDRGSLGEAYPEYDGSDPWGHVLGVKEGDTPAFLHLLRNGLNDEGIPGWGGWGGRYMPDLARSPSKKHYFDVKDEFEGEISERATVFRWRKAFQHSFEARMLRCILSPSEANIEPVAVLHGESERTVLTGDRVEMSAKGSFDRKGGNLSFLWEVYAEAGTYNGELYIQDADSMTASFIAPVVDQIRTIHIILTVTNDGKPQLSSNRRLVICVKP
jgi:hypothetical protein